MQHVYALRSEIRLLVGKLFLSDLAALSDTTSAFFHICGLFQQVVGLYGRPS